MGHRAYFSFGVSFSFFFFLFRVDNKYGFWLSFFLKKASPGMTWNIFLREKCKIV